MKKKIAIQGFKASFHEIAAKKFFGSDSISFIECDSFQKLVDKLKMEKADYGIMAIENSVAGTILPNYALIREANLKIFGEVFLRIEMNLVAMPGQKLSDINEVHSHPMAILQCTEFFRKHPQIRIVETKDTALCAKEIAEGNIMGRAALTSQYAAQLFGLEVLEASIESNKRNFTRFLALKRNDEDRILSKMVNKASISFRVKNIPGALSQALLIFGKNNINLTKIQSLPVLGEEWTYYIHADLEFMNHNTYISAMQEAASLMDELIILGEYACGDKTDL